MKPTDKIISQSKRTLL